MARNTNKCQRWPKNARNGQKYKLMPEMAKKMNARNGQNYELMPEMAKKY